MATLVELQAVPNRIFQLVKERILANRARLQNQDEKAQTASVRPRPQRQRFGARPDEYARPEPAATGKFAPGYFLTMAAWWYGPRPYGVDPPDWQTQGTQYIKPCKVHVFGKDGPTVIDSWSYGAWDLPADLLNGVTLEPLHGFSLVTGSPSISGEPFMAQLASYRKDTGPGSTGASEYTASNFTFWSFKQPPCATEDGLHYKFYYNYYTEEQTESELSHAFQTTHVYGRQTTPVYRVLDFTGNDMPINQVGHAHAVASWAYAYKLVYPLGGGAVHLFLQSKGTKAGVTSISSPSQSPFGVGHVVWLYLSHHLNTTGKPNKRYHVSAIANGTFTYTNNDNGQETHSGLRMVLVPVQGGTGLTGYGVDYYGLATHYFPTVDDIKADLAGSMAYTYFDDRYGLSTAYNQWIKQNTSGGVSAPPQPANADKGFVGDSDILGEYVECSKAGRAYVVYQTLLLKDDPVYLPELTSPHDLSGEIISPRPYLAPGNRKERRQALVRLKFLEIDAKTNTILREEGPTEHDMGDEEDANKTTWENLPSWFPSKRYRDAGWEGGQLNFDQLESYHLDVYYDWQAEKHFVRRRRLPQSQGIAAVVAELQNPTLKEELIPIPDVDAENIAWGVGGVYDPKSPPRPSRYGYAYSSSYYIAE
jgi:hypothetical protein